MCAMIPWKLLDRARVPASQTELVLYQRADEFSIRVAGQELMNSRVYASEDALAELACARIAERPAPRVLIGGLGMGYTLATALKRLGADAQVVVSELVPSVVAWNREHFGHLAGHPLRDPRVTVREEDVGAVMRKDRSAYDAIMLDVDNGPEGLTRKRNDHLYDRSGIALAVAALRPQGVLAVWGSGPSQEYVQRLRGAGLTVQQKQVRARGERGGARHTIFLATQEPHADRQA